MKLRVCRFLVISQVQLAYIAASAALMEYHCGNKDIPLASRIFEKAMELYGDEVEFVLRYLGFLISVNDENSMSVSIRF